MTVCWLSFLPLSPFPFLSSQCLTFLQWVIRSELERNLEEFSSVLSLSSLHLDCWPASGEVDEKRWFTPKVHSKVLTFHRCTTYLTWPTDLTKCASTSEIPMARTQKASAWLFPSHLLVWVWKSIRCNQETWVPVLAPILNSLGQAISTH